MRTILLIILILLLIGALPGVALQQRLGLLSAGGIGLILLILIILALVGRV